MANKITEYMVVYEEYKTRECRPTSEFREQIEELIRRGWEPIGGVHINDTGSTVKLGQAVVRRG